MLAISTGIREHLHVDGIELSIGISADPHFDAHFVAGKGGLEDFAAREGEARRFSGLQGYHGSKADVNMLFASKASAYGFIIRIVTEASEELRRVAFVYARVWVEVTITSLPWISI